MYRPHTAPITMNHVLEETSCLQISSLRWSQTLTQKQERVWWHSILGWCNRSRNGLIIAIIGLVQLRVWRSGFNVTSSASLHTCTYLIIYWLADSATPSNMWVSPDSLPLFFSFSVRVWLRETTKFLPFIHIIADYTAIFFFVCLFQDNSSVQGGWSPVHYPVPTQPPLTTDQPHLSEKRKRDPHYCITPTHR